MKSKGKSHTASPQSAEAPDEAIGRRIREARDERGLSQQAVSVRSKWVDSEEKGISRTALIGYEAGTSRPGTRELRLLCETLHVTPNFLMYGSESPFQALDVAREGIYDTTGELRNVVQLAFVLGALKGHEKDALVTLILALAGRQLGDVRLGGLRSFALMLLPEFEKALADLKPGDGPLAGSTLEDLVERFAAGTGSNLGNRLQFDEDGNIVGGRMRYPDPKDLTKAPPKDKKS